MYRTLIIALTVLLVIVGNSYSQPQLQFEGGDSHDFGEVLLENSPFLTVIKIKNIGTEDLQILDLEKDCGCTWAPIDKNLIAPGDFATINIKQTYAFTGNITKKLTLHTNDPNKSTVHYYIYAKVSSLSSVGTLLLNFSEVKPNETAKASVVLKNEKDFEVRILKVRNSSPNIKLNIKDGMIIPAKSQLLIEATITPKESGDFNEAIFLMTNDKDMGKVTIHAIGKVLKNIISH